MRPTGTLPCPPAQPEGLDAEKRLGPAGAQHLLDCERGSPQLAGAKTGPVHASAARGLSEPARIRNSEPPSGNAPDWPAETTCPPSSPISDGRTSGLPGTDRRQGPLSAKRAGKCDPRVPVTAFMAQGAAAG